jgi:hypothetical protein
MSELSPLDILESIYSLFPVQRFLVKLIYEIPLDGEAKTITARSHFGEPLHEFTEQEYLHYLYEEGRCNVNDIQHGCHEVVCSIGRRGGKTSLVGGMASYEAYRVASMDNPQARYGLPQNNKIQILTLSPDGEAAKILNQEIQCVLTQEIFRPHLSPVRNGSTMQFLSFRDIKAGANPTIRLSSRSGASFVGLRGYGNMSIFFDELALYPEGEAVYDAVVPSTAAFSLKDPSDKTRPIGPLEGRVVSFSTPTAQRTKFWELYTSAMVSGSKGVLALQMPTWDLNPTIPEAFFRKLYASDLEKFMRDFGAQF